MLHVFYAKTTVTRTVLFGDGFKNVEHLLVGAVADGMNDNLQTGLVRRQGAFQQDAFGHHIRSGQTEIVGLMQIRLEEKRGGRSERPIRQLYLPLLRRNG